MKDRSMQLLLSELEKRERQAEEGGGAARQERQRRLGRLNARERIGALVDQGSFQELGRHVKSRHAGSSARIANNLHPGDGLVCGLGAVEGRDVAVYAHDPTVMRGALGREGAKKLVRLLDLARDRQLPVLSLIDCEGVRVEEGTDAIHSFGEVIERTIGLKGRVPQVSLVCGLCVGGAAYTAVLTDCVGMIDQQTFMFVTGGKVTKVVTGEAADIEELGGPKLHAEVTGSCHAVLANEQEGMAWLKRVLSYLSPTAPCSDPVERAVPELEELVPTDQRRAYDMRKVLAAVFDQGSLLELSPRFAPNLLTSFARLGGRAVAVVASQPAAVAGCLDVNASRKGAAFVTWAQALGLPVVTLVDVPGYLPGKGQEEEGILAHGATLLTAYAQARVPRVCLIVRKSFGGASVLSFAADVRLAFPTARVDPMGPEATLEVVLGPEVPDLSEAERAERQRQKETWLGAHDHAWVAAEEGYVDQVISPSAARRELWRTLARLSPGGPA